eukprot:3180697-Pyramimonas_sp.AAC.1
MIAGASEVFLGRSWGAPESLRSPHGTFSGLHFNRSWSHLEASDAHHERKSGTTKAWDTIEHV